MVGSVYGEEHFNGRLLAIQYLAQLRYSYEALFTPELMEHARDEMFFVYQ